MTFSAALHQAILGARVRPVGAYWYVSHHPMDRHFRLHRDGFVEDYRLRPAHVRAEWEVVR